ncbi:MAG: hypothetical protein H0W12_00335 [Chitinophagaceae bacterium]|nr:hypothetical protein [Chitinophagaceae bacterium]
MPVLQGQIIISGTVYDSTKLYGVTNVLVSSTGGNAVYTDSLGIYSIKVSDADSLSFFYRHKSTIKFPVHTISNYNEFDVSLRVGLHEKYKPLKEVIVYSKNYHQDSVENRLQYAKIFNYERPGLHSSSGDGGPPGLDVDDLIHIFRFRKNKQNLAFRKRLITQEEDNYVNYKFNTVLIKRMTGLRDTLLEKYKNIYRPSYAFAVSSSEIEFYQYILATAKEFKRLEGISGPVN